MLAAGHADVRGDGVAVPGHGDVGEQQPGDALAFAGGVAGSFQIAGRSVTSWPIRACCASVSCPACCSAGLVVGVLCVGEGAQRGVPVGFEGVGDEPVGGVDGEVAAAGQVGVVAGALDVRGAQRVGLGGAVLEFGGDGEGGLDGQRGEGVDEQLPDGSSRPAPGIAADRGRVVDAVALAQVGGQFCCVEDAVHPGEAEDQASVDSVRRPRQAGPAPWGPRVRAARDREQIATCPRCVAGPPRWACRPRRGRPPRAGRCGPEHVRIGQHPAVGQGVGQFCDHVEGHTVQANPVLLIDPPSWPGHGPRSMGRFWSHLVSDASVAELHAFAELLGVPPARLRPGPLRRAGGHGRSGPVAGRHRGQQPRTRPPAHRRRPAPAADRRLLVAGDVEGEVERRHRRSDVVG